MCGIVGYIGKKDAHEILMGGLFDLEYRGYDSAGLKVYGQPVYKASGPVKNLLEKTKNSQKSNVGIAHTRWATHGLPIEKNAHPHSGEKGLVWLVHNGIIENYQELKKDLQSIGVKFNSDTDSEVLAQLIELDFIKNKNLELSTFNALKKVRGAYGIVVFSDLEPDKLIVAKMGSPLVIGIGDGENFIASDATPIIKYTKDVIYLDDGEIAILTANSFRIKNNKSELIEKQKVKIEWSTDEAKKDGFEHYMLKEIHEAPSVILNNIRGRIIEKDGLVKLGGLESNKDILRKIKNIYIVGCGSAYYSGLYGKYVMEELTSISVIVDHSSEFRYRNFVINENSLVIAISQSGETADTLEAVREAKRKGALTLGIVNVVGSSISRETDIGIYNRAGPEISVASTKAFVSQMSSLIILAIFLGRLNKLSAMSASIILNELKLLPNKIKDFLESEEKEKIKLISQKYFNSSNFLYIGRKLNFPIALEGALKLKEVSYIHAEGYGAGEMKHGPIAMIDESFPVVAIVSEKSMYEKMISNIQEIVARKGPVIIVSDISLDGFADQIIVPKTIEILNPIMNLVPLQLFAYFVSLNKGINVDRPRNLAKSVTVE